MGEINKGDVVEVIFFKRNDDDEHKLNWMKGVVNEITETTLGPRYKLKGCDIGFLNPNIRKFEPKDGRFRYQVYGKNDIAILDNVKHIHNLETDTTFEVVGIYKTNIGEVEYEIESNNVRLRCRREEIFKM